MARLLCGRASLDATGLVGLVYAACWWTGRVPSRLVTWPHKREGWVDGGLGHRLVGKVGHKVGHTRWPERSGGACQRSAMGRLLEAGRLGAVKRGN